MAVLKAAPVWLSQTPTFLFHTNPLTLPGAFWTLLLNSPSFVACLARGHNPLLSTFGAFTLVSSRRVSSWPKLFQSSEAWKATKCLLCCWSAAQFFSYVNDVICRWMWWIPTSSDEEGKKKKAFVDNSAKPRVPEDYSPYLLTCIVERDREREGGDRGRAPVGVY